MGLDGLNSQTYQYMGGRPGLLGIGSTSAAPVVQKNMAEQWAGSALNISAQQALSHKVDKIAANRTGTDLAEPVGRSYSRLLNLGTDQVRFTELSWDKLKQTASHNVSGFGQDLKSGKISPQTYAKETLGQRNFEPIKNLMTGNATKSLGQSLTNTAGGALVGYDVMRNARDTYKDAKAKEDGRLGSKLNTAGQTTAAVGKYGLRDATSWEGASAGAAVGKALLPVSIKGVPVGGVVFGALGGVLAHKTMNKALKTGELDPVQQRKAAAKAEKKAEKARE